MNVEHKACPPLAGHKLDIANMGKNNFLRPLAFATHNCNFTRVKDLWLRYALTEFASVRIAFFVQASLSLSHTGASASSSGTK